MQHFYTALLHISGFSYHQVTWQWHHHLTYFHLHHKQFSDISDHICYKPGSNLFYFLSFGYPSQLFFLLVSVQYRYPGFDDSDVECTCTILGKSRTTWWRNSFHLQVIRLVNNSHPLWLTHTHADLLHILPLNHCVNILHNLLLLLYKLPVYLLTLAHVYSISYL